MVPPTFSKQFPTLTKTVIQSERHTDRLSCYVTPAAPLATLCINKPERVVVGIGGPMSCRTAGGRSLYLAPHRGGIVTKGHRCQGGVGGPVWPQNPNGDIVIITVTLSPQRTLFIDSPTGNGHGRPLVGENGAECRAK